MYKTIFLLILFTLSLSTQAQETSEREIGIRLTSLEDFGFIYKHQRDENSFRRFRVGRFQTQLVNVNSITIFNVQAAFSYGVERRKLMTERLSFLYGPEGTLMLGYISGNNDFGIFNLGAGLGYLLGFQLELSKSFRIGLETIPGFSFDLGVLGQGGSTSSFNLGFDSNALALTGTYIW